MRRDAHTPAPSPLLHLVRALAALAEADDYARIQQETRHNEPTSKPRRRGA
jgi:hypothetical protein